LDVAKLSKLAADACEAEEEEVEILLPKVNGTILQKVLDFCEHHEKVEAS
jgi:dsDNA-specific endonuclease/ATPase MutS2